MTDNDRSEELEPETLAAIDERRQARWDALTDEERAQAAAAFSEVPF